MLRILLEGTGTSLRLAHMVAPPQPFEFRRNALPCSFRGGHIVFHGNDLIVNQRNP